MTRKWLRTLLLGTVLLALLLAGGTWLLLQSIDRGAVMARAVQEVKSATGRDFAIDGPVRLRLFPRLALVAEGVRLGNASWGSRPAMATVRELRFELALAPLLQRRVEIGRVQIHGADLLLETNAEGQGNWNFRRAGADAPAPRETPLAASVRVTLAELVAADSQLSWHSGRSGRSETLSIEALRLATHPDPARAPNTWQLALDTTWRGQQLHAEGGVGVQRDEGSGRRSIPLDLKLRTEGASASVDGNLGLDEAAGQARLRVDAEVQHGRALAPWIGGIEWPVPVPTRLRGALDWRPRELVVDDFVLESQGQRLAGRITWNRATTPPALQLALHADGLDLARWYPPQQAAAPVAAKGERVFSEAPFPALKLPRLAIQAELRAERLVLPNGLELTSVQAAGSSRADRLEVSQLAFGLARGRFDVSGSWEPTGAPPRVSLNLGARGVAMDALLALMRRKVVLSGGRTDIDARLGASGASPHGLAASLNGELRLRMGEASSVGTRTNGAAGDLVEALLHALTPLRRSEDTVRVLCAAARLPIRDGRIVVDRSIAVEGERVDMVMQGGIDLGAERIDLAMRPTVKKGTGLDPTAFAGAVKIAGPLAAPQVQVNLAGTAREAVNISAAVATGGATWVGERLLGKVIDAHPCESAYNGSAKTSTAKGAAPAASAKADTGPLRRMFER